MSWKWLKLRQRRWIWTFGLKVNLLGVATPSHLRSPFEHLNRSSWEDFECDLYYLKRKQGFDYLPPPPKKKNEYNNYGDNSIMLSWHHK